MVNAKIAGVGAVVIAALCTTFGSAQTESRRATSIERFNERIQAYVALHRQVERFMPPQRIFTDPAEAERAMVTMATAMRAMRPDAREGEVFDAEVANHFRDVIWRALEDAGLVSHVVAGAMIPEVPGNYPPPVVNGTFSWALANDMPSCVLRALPELPIELQYRFVGFDLVLIDLHPNLVVDILRDALPGDDFRGPLE